MTNAAIKGVNLAGILYAKPIGVSIINGDKNSRHAARLSTVQQSTNKIPQRHAMLASLQSILRTSPRGLHHFRNQSCPAGSLRLARQTREVAPLWRLGSSCPNCSLRSPPLEK
jgi:hypothetical protein